MKDFTFHALKEPPFYFALIVASMFVSTFTGGIGYILYYPMLLFICLYYNRKIQRNNLNSVFGWFLLACLLSILLNEILPVFKTPFRFTAYTILLFGITPILFNRKKAVMCFKFLQYTCLLLVFVGFLNYYLYRTGSLSIMEGNRVYAGTIGTNYLGMLCSMGILYAGSLLLYRKNIKKIYILIFTGLLLGLLLCLLLSSSRNSIVGIIGSALIMIYIQKKGKIGSTVTLFVMLAVLAIFTFPIWEDYTVGILDKQGGSTESFNMRSRESTWLTRWDEFTSSPIYGIGFASVSNPTEFSLMTGMVETTTGWGGLLSQLGLLGAVPFIMLTYKNFRYLLSRKDGHFVHCLLGALLTFFCINSLGEGYITTVGCQFTVYFFLTQGIIYSLRMGWISINHLKPLFFNQKRV